jgi:hypothetical protein
MKIPNKNLLVKYHCKDEECTYYFYSDHTYACRSDSGSWSIALDNRTKWNIKNGLFYYKHSGQGWVNDHEYDDGHTNAGELINAINDALMELYLLGYTPSDTK